MQEIKWKANKNFLNLTRERGSSSFQLANPPVWNGHPVLQKSTNYTSLADIYTLKWTEPNLWVLLYETVSHVL